jgi:hypothetical protein
MPPKSAPSRPRILVTKVYRHSKPEFSGTQFDRSRVGSCLNRLIYGAEKCMKKRKRRSCRRISKILQGLDAAGTFRAGTRNSTGHMSLVRPTFASIKSPKVEIFLSHLQPKKFWTRRSRMCNALRSRLSNRDPKHHIVLRRLNRSTISYTEASLSRRCLEDSSGRCLFSVVSFSMLPSPNCFGIPSLSSCRDTFSETTICLPLCSLDAQ